MASIRTDLSTARRVYVQTAYGEPIVARLKRLGAHWDAAVKCWWLGAAKKEEVQALLVDADQRVESGAEPAQAAEDLSKARVYAQVEYQGRRYYVIAEQKGSDGLPVRARLTTLDGLQPFWVDCAACQLVRTYEGREVWDGRRYSGRTEIRYQTIGSLRDFRDQQQRARASGEPVCAGCGKAGGELVTDLEDGCLKHRSCCDIEP